MSSDLGRVLERMQSCLKLPVVSIDCEMVGVGAKGSENALARVSIVDEYCHVLLDVYVKPPRRITDYRTAITGICAKHLECAPSAATIVQRVAELLSHRIVVGHALWNDWEVLGLQVPREFVRDTSTYAELRPPSEPERLPKLSALSWYWLNRRIQMDCHDSIEDSQAAIDLYIMHRESWEAVRAAEHEAVEVSAVEHLVSLTRPRPLHCWTSLPVPLDPLPLKQTRKNLPEGASPADPAPPEHEEVAVAPSVPPTAATPGPQAAPPVPNRDAPQACRAQLSASDSPYAAPAYPFTTTSYMPGHRRQAADYCPAPVDAGALEAKNGPPPAMRAPPAVLPPHPTAMGPAALAQGEAHRSRRVTINSHPVGAPREPPIRSLTRSALPSYAQPTPSLPRSEVVATKPARATTPRPTRDPATAVSSPSGGPDEGSIVSTSASGDGGTGRGGSSPSSGGKEGASRHPGALFFPFCFGAALAGRSVDGEGAVVAPPAPPLNQAEEYLLGALFFGSLPSRLRAALAHVNPPTLTEFISSFATDWGDP